MLILCLYYFKTTVLIFSKDWLYTKNVLKRILFVLYYSLVGQFDIFSYSSFTYFHIYTHTEKCGRNETLYGSKKVKVTSFFLFFLFFSDWAHLGFLFSTSLVVQIFSILSLYEVEKQCSFVRQQSHINFFSSYIHL